MPKFIIIFFFFLRNPKKVMGRKEGPLAWVYSYTHPFLLRCRVKRAGSIMQTNEHREVKAPTCLFLLQDPQSLQKSAEGALGFTTQACLLPR